MTTYEPPKGHFYVCREGDYDAGMAGTKVDATAVIGRPPEMRSLRRDPSKWRGVEIKYGATIEAGVTVDAGVFRDTFIGKCFLMKKVHVAHDCVIGDGCELAPFANILGECVLEENVRVGGSAVVLPQRTIGEGARIGAGAVVTRDIPAGEVWVGNPARRLK